MSEARKAELDFDTVGAVALHVPVRTTKTHQSHALDDFIIELEQDGDTATLYLSEVDVASGSIPVTRKSVSFPLGLLADLVRRRPLTPTEKEDFARAEREEEQEFGDGEDEEDEGQRV